MKWLEDLIPAVVVFSWAALCIYSFSFTQKYDEACRSAGGVPVSSHCINPSAIIEVQP